jgi:hypothetical protein
LLAISEVEGALLDADELALLDADELALLDVDESILLGVDENESGDGGAASILSSLTRFLKGARLAISLRTCLARLMLKCPEPVATFSIIICTIRARHSGLLAANSSTRLSIGVSQVLSLAAVGIVLEIEAFLMARMVRRAMPMAVSITCKSAALAATAIYMSKRAWGESSWGSIMSGELVPTAAPVAALLLSL